MHTETGQHAYAAVRYVHTLSGCARHAQCGGRCVDTFLTRAKGDNVHRKLSIVPLQSQRDASEAHPDYRGLRRAELAAALRHDLTGLDRAGLVEVSWAVAYVRARALKEP